MDFEHFEGNIVDLLLVLQYRARFGAWFFHFYPPTTFNHANGTWLFDRAFSKYIFYQPTRGLCYIDEIRMLNSNGASWMRRGCLQDFSDFGKRHDTLEDLAYQYEVLRKYRHGFIQSTSRSYGFDGRRLEVVSRELRSLIVDNAAINGGLGRHWGANIELIMLFDQAYNVRTDNVAYCELLREYKELVAAAERVSLVDISLTDSIKETESLMAYALHNEQLLNFRRNCCIGVTFIGIASAVLAKMFG